MLALKQNIYNHCLQLLEQNKMQLQSELEQVTEAANNETKSSAGDKHETARAMMQIEQEKLSGRLTEAMDQLATLKHTDLKPTARIAKGSVVETDTCYFFLSIGLGKLIVDEKIIFVISPQSPLGIKLMGLKQHEKAELNGTIYVIRSIL